MKALLVILTVAFLALIAAGPALAMDGSMCTGDMTTLDSLHQCVVHAIEMGHVDSPAVGQSLLSKVEAAQVALAQGQTDATILILQAFISQVSAQSGIHIDAQHAQHMIMHAQAVIGALSQ